MTTSMVFPKAEIGLTLRNIFFNQGGSNLGYKRGSIFDCKKHPTCQMSNLSLKVIKNAMEAI